MILGRLKALCAVKCFGWAQGAHVIERLDRRSRVSRETSAFYEDRNPGRPGKGASGALLCRKGCQRRQSILQCLSMLTRQAVRELLAPFNAGLPDEGIESLLEYLGLLLRWNQKINLTSIRTPEECITRHFGESFLMANVVPPCGRLLDIGSGAGFPGLAIKLLAPDLEVVLLEPVAKKRAFLKEVARACGMGRVSVLGSRAEEFSRTGESGSFDIVTLRAVGGLRSLVPAAASLLKPGGHLCLWVGSQQVAEISKMDAEFQWLEPVPIPLSQERKILVGKIRRH